MKKSLSRKNIESIVDADGSLHGSTKGISRSLSNVKLSKTLSKGDTDAYWWDISAEALYAGL